MGISSWFCTNGSKNMLVKIVHPGGHVELHDRPVLAAEIMLRNPRCIVAHPHVFRQPWAIVAPDTMLMLGQKFYVVPVSTIRKLQRRSLKHSPSPVRDIRSESTQNDQEKDDDDDDNISFFSCNFMNKNIKVTYACLLHVGNEDGKRRTDSNMDECMSDDKCFMCLIKGSKIKAHGDHKSGGETASSRCESPDKRENNKDLTRGSLKGLTSLDHWRPNLESINEE